MQEMTVSFFDAKWVGPEKEKELPLKEGEEATLARDRREVQSVDDTKEECIA